MFNIDGVKELIVKDFNEQHLNHLIEWSIRIPEYISLLESEMDGKILKEAMLSNRWLLYAYLLNIQNINQKADQIILAKLQKNTDAQKLVECHILQKESVKMVFIAKLHNQVKL